jgi:hypothetical protein
VITFNLADDDHRGELSVVGSFNDWTPGVDVFAARGDGTQTATIRVAKDSEVYFRYLGSGDHWFDDPSAATDGTFSARRCPIWTRGRGVPGPDRTSVVGSFSVALIPNRASN